ncbi:putative membrane protein YGL010W [Inhella inkyongensis]|uniref:Putative membrane protein YGL010W n=1 Tax=Inhella inkyongensis TaxID=392593 RepID=A0A840S924_9BURK|nr:Mpo1-like protein [Inhella inkyongensis]MBB5205496.1 putative membrane protein YGL010W [Inhella inkyongensis]
MASPFRPALDLLAMYAAYHRDRRNIATHFVGIPLIVYAVAVLMARPVWELGGVMLAPIHGLLLLTTLWYLTRGEFVLGVATSAVNALLAWAALPLGALPTAEWLAWGLGLFVLGWVIQFVGHKYEGRKPAFVDDLVGLLVGPMFVVAEALFALGWGKPLLTAIEMRVGPTRSAA